MTWTWSVDREHIPEVLGFFTKNIYVQYGGLTVGLFGSCGAQSRKGRGQKMKNIVKKFYWKDADVWEKLDRRKTNGGPPLLV